MCCWEHLPTIETLTKGLGMIFGKEETTEMSMLEKGEEAPEMFYLVIVLFKNTFSNSKWKCGSNILAKYFNWTATTLD